MIVPIWASELARAFWLKARHTEPFPRSLQQPIKRAVPLSVVLVPKLCVSAAFDWLRHCGILCELPGKDRPLRACLVARRNHAVALVDDSHDGAEQRFSIAHELAHFLRDYWSPRQRVLKRLGKEARAVLDGERPPTAQDRLHALLRDVALGFHLHLMERDDHGKPLSVTVAQSENDADRLAYELLAPAEHVHQAGLCGGKPALVRRLRQFYGLPALQASRYAEILLPPVVADPLLLRLRSVLKNK